MGKSLKFFHKKHHSHDGIMKFCSFSACSKSSPVYEPVKQSLIEKDKEEAKTIGQGDTPHATVVQNAEVKPLFTVHPQEPAELDRPIRCPQPEPGILQDGRIFNERKQAREKTRGALQFLTETELQVMYHSKQYFLNDRLIFPSASAPAPSISKMLE